MQLCPSLTVQLFCNIFAVHSRNVPKVGLLRTEGVRARVRELLAIAKFKFVMEFCANLLVTVLYLFCHVAVMSACVSCVNCTIVPWEATWVAKSYISFLLHVFIGKI